MSTDNEEEGSDRQFQRVDSSEAPFDDLVEFDPEPLAEDLYGVGITSFIRDVRKLVMGEGRLCLRLARMTVTLIVLWMTIAMQVFLLCEFKRVITAGSVHRIRVVYSEYEVWMYNGTTVSTVNGFQRGIAGHFDASRFDSLPEHIGKQQVCSFPLSQPYFSCVLLMVWTFTVIADVRRIQFHADLLLVRTDTVDSAQEMLEDAQTTLLKGLTMPVKVMMATLIFLPRLGLDLILLWLGCRWLLATMDLADVLLNAIALEFILLLKDLISAAVVPKRNVWETSTLLIPHKRKTSASWESYMGAFLWFVATVAWALLYMFYFQQVLPDYRWDVHQVCETFIAEMTSLTAGDDKGSIPPSRRQTHM